MTEAGSSTRESAGAAALIRPTRPSLGDIAVAGASLLFLTTLTAETTPPTGGAPSTALAIAASVVMAVAMAWRRSHPAGSAITVYAAALAHFVTGTVLVPADVLVLVSLYAVTVYGPRWARRAGLGGALMGAALLAGAVATQFGGVVLGAFDQFLGALLSAGFTFVAVAALVLAVWALALVRKARVERLEAIAERAHRLEVERDQQAQIATAAERARIAREMHDVVAHSLSVVIAQADGGRYAVEQNPEAAHHALETIADSGRSALADLRRILGVLRNGEADPELSPQPAAHDLEPLLTPLRQAGVDVTMRQIGIPRPLPAGTGLGLYRIVQESLTNVVKHAGPTASAEVVLQWHLDEVELWVTDDGVGGAVPAGDVNSAGGLGLMGMRERATMLGGAFAAGPGADGGWVVYARVPVTPVPAERRQEHG